MEQKIVVHMKDGVIHKGITQNFEPGTESFHFLPAEGGGVPMRIRLENMKAMFWVKDYIGNRHFVPRREFDASESESRSHRAVVTFADGEEIWGTLDEGADRGPGFFLYPSDKQDNNIRIYVVRSALKELRLAD